MEYRRIGTKYEYIKLHSKEHSKPYNYKRNGLLSKIMSPVIVNTENKVTQLVLRFVETAAIFLLGYVDELKHFKNWGFK